MISSSQLPWSRKRLLIACLSLIAVFLAAKFSAPTLAKIHWRHDWSWYDMGFSGLAPLRHYHSFEHASIDLRFMSRDSRCSTEQFFLATRGSDTEPGAVILDHTGQLQWRQPKMATEVHDFRVQEYRGQKFLTFWAGTPDHGGKEGSWYMMDNTYTIRHEISSPGFKFGDMHEFQITDNDTALLTVYNPTPMDLSPIGGAKEGYILDGIFQEIDIESDKVLFQWNASSHIPLDASDKSFKGCSDDPKKAFLGCGNSKDSAFDYYHINSVQKDTLGNYLVSGRHTSSLTYIDSQSGRVLWHMGGHLNEFKYLPEGTEKLFTWQHHARMYNNSIITLLDNNAVSYNDARTESRALQLEVDLESKTVSAQQIFKHPKKPMAFSQGNAQLLEESGNVLVGWGNCAAFTEFSPEGNVLCDARFAPAAFFSFQPLSSYRVFHGTWVGKPKDTPNVVAAKGKLFVSWNGATEVTTWRVEGSLNGDQFLKILEIPKTGFETQIAKAFGEYRSVRVVALDKAGDVLGTSNEIPPPYLVGGLYVLETLLISLVGIAAASCICVYIGCRFLRRRRRLWHLEKGYKPLETIE